MTPEEAQALEPGTTPGPWTARHGSDNTSYVQEAEWFSAIGSAEFGHVEAEYTPADANLIAAAPDMRATIANLRWEYGVEQDNPMCNHIEHGADPTQCRTIAWAPDEDTARSHAAMRFRADRHPRIVRRMVGPVEVVE
jgi:hypothetical protein